MTQLIDSISMIADQFDAIVLDQWGVLHDGSAPYPNAPATLERLGASAAKLGVLSNSGKRAAPNASRIAAMGFNASQFDCVMTSGEALWQIFASDAAAVTSLYPVEGSAGDAINWAHGLDLALENDLTKAQAILLMGLPDGAASDTYRAILQTGVDRGLPLYCSNPDLTSPRGGGTYVMSPGALAQEYQTMGGAVQLFGKPHRPIFQAMQTALDCAPDKILMVGDSLHHDILGAQTAGWCSLLIEGGIHAPDIGEATRHEDIDRLAKAAGVAAPDYTLSDLR